MEHARPVLSRRHLLAGAAAAATAYGPLGAAPARAAPRAAYPPTYWTPAATGNYTAANRPAQYPVQYVIVHVTQETYADTIKIFQDPNRKVSAHYVVRSSDGRIAQCVRERDVAWHAGNWTYNTRGIGIEHEGWVHDPRWFTDALYAQSARLTAAVCDRFGIPKDRRHIIGHAEVPGADHTDPGQYWDWARYLRLVAAAR
ncbi:peptidoglycan recognition family protein [Streptomyces sp. NPDC003077]|uniref:N-acetylmuramoyl-L-alanine amidase n=1 Tax=Streptomyces sp. NPDC003077 TaxID=3154443 RepID=UPI0033A2505E